MPNFDEKKREFQGKSIHERGDFWKIHMGQVGKKNLEKP